MAKSGIWNFFREVRAEISRITWPSRKETVAGTIAVFVMVFIASTYLYLSDQIIAWLVKIVLTSTN